MENILIAIQCGKHPMAAMLRQMVADYEQDVRVMNSYAKPYRTLTARHQGPVMDKDLYRKVAQVKANGLGGKLSVWDIARKLAA